MEQVYRYNRGTIDSLTKAEELIAELEDAIYKDVKTTFILAKRYKELHQIDVDIYKPDDFHIINLVLNNYYPLGCNRDNLDRKCLLFCGVRGQRTLLMRSNPLNQSFARPSCVYVKDTDFKEASILKENTVIVTLRY